MTPLTASPSDWPSEDEIVRFLASLDSDLSLLLARLQRRFPLCIARDAVEKARSCAIDALLQGPLVAMAAPARRAWLWEVARCAATTLLARSRTHPLADDPAQPGSPLTDQDRTDLLTAVASLTEDLRRGVEVVYFDGLSLRSAAEVLGIPEATFRRHHERALVALRQLLSREAGQSK
jgi:DNA-directed RNA polymerase specialized sigma24 family protein